MLRILVAVDDYGESLYLLTLLKKLGFDADAVGNAVGFDEVRLRHNPEIILASAQGKRISGMDLIKQVKKRNGLPHFLLLYPADLYKSASIQPPANVSAVLETPVATGQLIKAISQLAGLDEEQLFNKYRKLKQSLSQSKDESDRVLLSREQDNAGELADSVQNSKAPEEARQERFKIALAQLPKAKVDGFTRSKVMEVSKAIRVDEKKNQSEIQALDQERREFVDALFKDIQVDESDSQGAQEDPDEGHF